MLVYKVERVVGSKVEERENKVEEVGKKINNKVDKEIEINKTD
jgi:hypothetical protein